MHRLSALVLAVLLTIPLGASPVAAVSGGPIVLMGIDAEDGGPGGHGPIANYTSITNSVLANVTNGGSGIVVFGGDPTPCSGSDVQDFWNAIGPAATPAQTVTYAIGATNVATQSLAGAAVMVVSSDYLNTFCGGLTQEEHDTLTLRQADIAAFVNGGGGLIAFSSDFSNPYAWITTVGSFTVTTGLGYSDINPTADGTAIGVTDALDICCWHDVYTTYPSFLTVLATDAGSGEVAALGGASVVIPPENCTDGIDNDRDGLIDAADPDCQGAPPTATTASGTKYYDSNTNGQLDPGEAGLASWPIDYGDGTTSASVLTDAVGNFTVDLSSGTYSFAERQGAAPWIQTGNSVDQSGGTADTTLNPDMSYTVAIDAGETTTGLNFGNVCIGRGGGRTLGFWSNKNGQALIAADDLALLASLNLVKADGTPFNPTTRAQLAAWLKGASATNMAYMLSAQLAAMALNVHNGLVDGSSLVYAPGTLSANAAGFATVDALMAEANAELGAHPTAYSGDAWRGYQETLKNALDKANNNRTFVQDDASTCGAPFKTVSFNLYADGSVSCAGADDLSRTAGSVTFVESTGQVLFSVSLDGAAPNATYDLNISEEPTCSNVQAYPAAIATDASGDGFFSSSFAKAPGTYNLLVNFVTSPIPSDPTNREIATTDTSVTVH